MCESESVTPNRQSRRTDPSTRLLRRCVQWAHVEALALAVVLSCPIGACTTQLAELSGESLALRFEDAGVVIYAQTDSSQIQAEPGSNSCDRTGLDASTDHSSAAATDTSTTCSDERVSGDESDVDCGGMNCSVCGVGMACQFNSDCESGICAG